MLKPADLDPSKYERYMQGLRDQQNLMVGLVGGTAAAAVGAVLWAGVTYATEYKLGIAAIVLGILVGTVIRKLGRGVDLQFRILGAVLALLSCLTGDLLVVCGFIAKQQGLTVLGVLSQLRFDSVIKLAKLTFNGGDLVFYAIAVYEGFRLSAKKLTQADYVKISQMP